MKNNLKHIKKFNESTTDITYKVQKVEKEGLYEILHQKYFTDRYDYGTTIVSAYDKEEAMRKLNEYIANNKNTCYDEPCKNINHVQVLRVIE
jgi:hypothetical protein